MDQGDQVEEGFVLCELGRVNGGAFGAGCGPGDEDRDVGLRMCVGQAGAVSDDSTSADATTSARKIDDTGGSFAGKFFGTYLQLAVWVVVLSYAAVRGISIVSTLNLVRGSGYVLIVADLCSECEDLGWWKKPNME